MSTLDPGLEPPGDWQPPYAPPPPGPNESARRAAVYVWLTAAAGLVMTCCCMLNAVIMYAQPRMVIDQFFQELPPELQGTDMNQLVTIFSAVLVVVYIVMLLAPSVVMLLLGFSVRAAGRWQTVAAMALALYFAVLAAIGVIFGLINVLSTGVAALIPIVIFGGWFALTIATFNALRQATRPGQTSGPMHPGASNDPWAM